LIQERHNSAVLRLAASLKPDPEFFRQMIAAVPHRPDAILYVGDRLDNDILPAARLGLRTALVKRGPWAVIQRDDPDAIRVPTFRIDSLAELPSRIAAFNAGAC
jgi:FMN phosphatase YigB (HAD superfamily)